jgi:hypothetical protein
MGLKNVKVLPHGVRAWDGGPPSVSATLAVSVNKFAELFEGLEVGVECRTNRFDLSFRLVKGDGSCLSSLFHSMLVGLEF